MSEQHLTFGEKACGVDFNPDGDLNVQQIKRQFADIVDHLDRIRAENALNHDMARMLSIAITEAQTAQMWAVKAVTWRH